MTTVPTIDGRFIKADEKLRAALAELEATRTAVSNAYQNVQLAGGVPEVTRNLSIAITEAEGALLRLEHARGRFNVVKGR